MTNFKYIYRESVSKGTEGGEIGGVSRWKRLNAYYKNKNVKFSTDSSVYVGQYTRIVEATTLAEMKKAFTWLKKQWSDIDDVSEALTWVEKQ